MTSVYCYDKHLTRKSLFEITDTQCTSITLLSPVFVGDDTPLHLLVVLADANSQPGAKLAVVEGVHNTEHLPLVKA